jgi:hypothetical protein
VRPSEMKTRTTAWADEVFRLLQASWSRDTSSLWCPEVPSRGQCGVTALVINDMFGGEILKTHIGSKWHFYNRIDRVTRDFTASQFPEPILYQDLPSTREEAFGDTSESQYATLSKAFRVAQEAACCMRKGEWPGKNNQ